MLVLCLREKGGIESEALCSFGPRRAAGFSGTDTYLRRSSGRWSVGLPCPGSFLPSTNVEMLKDRVGPEGKCTMSMPDGRFWSSFRTRTDVNSLFVANLLMSLREYACLLP